MLHSVIVVDCNQDDLEVVDVTLLGASKFILSEMPWHIYIPTLSTYYLINTAWKNQAGGASSEAGCDAPGFMFMFWQNEVRPHVLCTEINELSWLVWRLLLPQFTRTQFLGVSPTTARFLEARGIFRSLRRLAVPFAAFEHFIILFGFHFGYYFFPAWLHNGGQSLGA